MVFLMQNAFEPHWQFSWDVLEKTDERHARYLTCLTLIHHSVFTPRLKGKKAFWRLLYCFCFLETDKKKIEKCPSLCLCSVSRSGCGGSSLVLRVMFRCPYHSPSTGAPPGSKSPETTWNTELHHHTDMTTTAEGCDITNAHINLHCVPPEAVNCAITKRGQCCPSLLKLPVVNCDIITELQVFTNSNTACQSSENLSQ